jgi:hypothetical protein
LQEFVEMAEWIGLQKLRAGNPVQSLPSPAFSANGKRYVSFSSNNYLSLATSTRLIDAARRGLETYGVGNCESRLLGGNLLSPAFAQNQNGQNGPNGQQGGQNGNGTVGAPAPLIGAGLPGLAIGIGYGIYWLRRRRNVG